jgi:hypothetical protein
MDKGPSKAYPISTGEMPKELKDVAAMARFVLRAYDAMKRSTFAHGEIVGDVKSQVQARRNMLMASTQARHRPTPRSTVLFTIGSKV